MSELKIKSSVPKYKGESDFANVNIKDEDHSPLRVSVCGVLIMEPRLMPHDDYGDSYKFGVRFDEDELFKLDQALLAVGHHAPEWTEKPAHEDGTIFFKLATDKTNSKFTADISPKISPRKIENDKISTDMDVTVEFSVGGWYKRDIEKFGLTLKVKKVVFGTPKK